MLAHNMKYLYSLKNKNLSNQICLLRVDFNLTDDDLKKQEIPLRMRTVLPTIKFLLDKGAKVVILSHRGRPKSARRTNSEFRIKNLEFSLKPFTGLLSKLLKKTVKFVNFNIMTSDVLNIDVNFGTSDVLLLENLRFLAGEDKNDQKFAKNLASLGTFYVNEAFAFSHRPTASMTSIPKFLPSYAGLLLQDTMRHSAPAAREHSSTAFVGRST